MDLSEQPIKHDSAEPEMVEVILGYAGAALSLKNIRYPVTMSRETLEGVETVAPQKIEDEGSLRNFCAQADAEDRAHLTSRERGVNRGYWKIKSVEKGST